MATVPSLSFATTILGFHLVRSTLRTHIPPVFNRNTLRHVGPLTDSTLSFWLMTGFVCSVARVDKEKWATARRRLPIVFASDAKSPEEEQEAIKKSESSGQGPPFLTILAAIVVLLLIVWVVGSILLWLIGLIVNVPPRS
ncbi:hypothetical protein H6P81_018356 [Aristolochia fimbriata]|uniref:Uncharacterized protein n=1 Tax=Aristolochia fimbriata TaxID=158543 RepID=A0AAV7E3W9_ARIFI|nr:hypothetical protein H6P81_018356 [Aristolochia fimbriata]